MPTRKKKKRPDTSPDDLTWRRSRRFTKLCARFSTSLSNVTLDDGHNRGLVQNYLANLYFNYKLLYEKGKWAQVEKLLSDNFTDFLSKRS